MLGLSDILRLLDHWPKWKDLTGLPARVQALEERLKALEASKPPSPTDCPAGHGAMAFVSERPDPTFGVVGVKLRLWRCPTCGFETEVERKPG